MKFVEGNKRRTVERQELFGRNQAAREKYILGNLYVVTPYERDPHFAKQIVFVRDYDLQRLPDAAVLWERAVRTLHEQKDDERARQALVKLEKLAPEKASALREELQL